MARVKRSVNATKKRRTTLERASGYRGQRSRLYRKAERRAERADRAPAATEAKPRKRSENIDADMDPEA